MRKKQVHSTKLPFFSHQVSQTDGESTLPHWMSFRPQTNSLVGLAFAEEFGIYHLKVSGIGKVCLAHFHVHILERKWTSPERSEQKHTSSCFEGETTLWTSLLLDLNPVTLDASQRITLSSSVTNYLSLPKGFVYLFSRQKQEKRQRYGQGVVTEDTLNTLGDVAELVWLVSCGKKQLSDSAERPENTVKQLERFLEVPVLGLRVFHSPGGTQHKIKRDLKGLRFTPSPVVIVPTPQVDMTGPTSTIDFAANTANSASKGLSQPLDKLADICFHSPNHNIKFLSTTLYLPFDVKIGCGHSNWFQKSKRDVKQVATSQNSQVEATASSEKAAVVSLHFSTIIYEHHYTTGLLSSPCFAAHTSTVRTCTAADSPLSLSQSSPMYSIHPTQLLTTVSYSAPLLPTRLTPQPLPKETPRWTGLYTAGHSDSERQPWVSSLGLTIDDKETVSNFSTAQQTPHNLPSASYQPPAESDIAAQELNSSLTTEQSLPPSNRIPSTQLFPDASPTSRLMTGHLSKTHSHSGTIKHLSPIVWQDVMSQLLVTTQDVSSTTWTGQLTLSERTELETSLSPPIVEPSMTVFTPVPPEFDCHRERLETINALSPDILFMSRKPTLHMSSPVTRTLQMFSIPSSLFKDQPSGEQQSFQSAHQSIHLLPSLQPTLRTLLVTESQETKMFSQRFTVTGKSTKACLETEVLTGAAQSLSGTFPVPATTSDSSGLVLMDHFDPTAPSAVQESYTSSLYHQTQSLDPSFPCRGQSLSNNNLGRKGSCFKTTMDYSQYERTAFPSKFFILDSNEQFFSTQTSRKYLSLNPDSLISDAVSREQTESDQFTLLLLVSTPNLYASTTAGTYHTLTPLQIETSREDSGLSLVPYSSFKPKTSAPSEDCIRKQNSMSICEPFTSDSSGPTAEGRPTQQIPGTFLSPFYGALTTLLASSAAAGFSENNKQSSVGATSPSASISSPTNLPPEVMQPVPVLKATIGFPFHFKIPPMTFLDPEDGDAHALFLEVKLIDGPPFSIGTWFSLDSLELHGVPLEVDLQFAPQDALLIAQDKEGLRTWLHLTIDLQRSPVEPCHIFTVTAQRSLHWILGQRHRVELLLGKLSQFFNSSSEQQFVIVSLKPGSIVISFFEHSMCEAGQCNLDQIQSMWMAMGSSDGSVNPVFREAMLPEFPITKIEPVSYKQDCFSTTSTPIFNASTPAFKTTLKPSVDTNTSLNSSSNTCNSKQINHYQWMAAMFTAVLVVCVLILITILVAMVLHFRRLHGRSRSGAIWPAGRVDEYQDDLSAIGPRRPPIFQTELPPPPLRLWMNFPQGDEQKLPPTFEQGRKSLDKELQPHPPSYDLSSI
ncbi:uncharacterized protein LOC122870992 isoform X1 [Xyrichtys novacula]|uniref:Uncharacterized protein LOC122870992 isoform X1 n=1 Tax=Xyrichtys novacula TaxID=13765 RepID=A0AAV1F127_XYRNO|nr:uncharacterized protein LOC122870992 isoform X1 [Xyrichtys novacula]